MKDKMIKGILLGMTIVIGLLLAGCTKAKTPNDDTGPTTAIPENVEVDTDNPVTIRFNWWGGDARHQATLDAIRLFQEEYPNITVVPEYAAWTGHEEKVALALDSGTAADIIQVNYNWPFDYSPKGDKFYDLNKLSGILDLNVFAKQTLESLTIHNALQAVPVSMTGRVFYWNQTTFDQIDVGIPLTLDELYQAGEEFAAFEDGSYYPLYLNEYDRMQLMVYYLESKYGKDWVLDGSLQYSKEEIVEGLNFINLLEEHHVTPTLAVIAGDGAESVDKNPKWVAGKYAGIYEWDSSAARSQNALSDGQKFIVGDYINMGEYHGGYTKVSMGYAISATTMHPVECAAFINFLINNEEAVKILGDTRGVPASTKGLDALRPALVDNIVAQANAKVLEWAKFNLDSTFESSALKNTNGAYSQTMQRLSDGEAPETCADYLMEAVSSELSKRNN